MKKVIFISALAIAAAVSCTKSDIVDTKFNEEISFETYTGRDAMTKATPYGQKVLPSAVGVYGFYTGTTPYSDGTSVANLWENLQVSKGEDGKWSYASTETRYWTNATDLYTFLAYAPYAITEGDKANGIVANNATGKKGATITYTHPTSTNNDVVSLGSGVDLLYANAPATDGVGGHVNMVKPTNDGPVNLQFKHALSRITVTAQKATDATAGFDFDVKEVYMTGAFNAVGTLNLATATPGATDDATDTGWSNLTQKTAKFEFYNDPTASKSEANGEVSWDVLSQTAKTNYGSDDYLMVIPTNFTTNGVKLVVKYTTIYANQESGVMTKEVVLKNNFKMGKAYSIDLAFSADVDAITFDVSVEDWDDEKVIDGQNPEQSPWAEPQA